MSLLSKIGSWFAKVFKAIKDDADTVAISITQEVKAFAASPTAGALVGIADKLLGSTVPQEVLTLINTNINQVLATELAIKGLPDNPTAEDIQAFETAVVTAITGQSPIGASKLWTTLAAQVYGIIETQVNSKSPMTFAQLVADVEQAYLDYQQDQAQQ